jgi:hypothetical protein
VDRIRWGAGGCGTPGGGTKYAVLGFGNADANIPGLAMAVDGTATTFALNCLSNTCTAVTSIQLVNPQSVTVLATIVILPGETGIKNAPLAVPVANGDPLCVICVSPADETDDKLTFISYLEVGVL